jgi:uncharacterized membrane protein
MLQNSLLLLGAFSALWYGIYGLLYSLIIVNILITLVNAYFSGKLIDYGLKNQVKDLHPILTLNITLAVVFYILQITFFQELQDLWNLITAAMLFFTSYLGTAFLLKMRVTTDLLLYIKKN